MKSRIEARAHKRLDRIDGKSRKILNTESEGTIAKRFLYSGKMGVEGLAWRIVGFGWC
jgi:hypothetical protein